MKPRIRLKRRAPVFSAKIWICEGFGWYERNWCVGAGWTPQEAFYNWKNQSSYMY